MAWSNPVFAKDAKVHLISETPDQPNSDPYPYINMAGLEDFKSSTSGGNNDNLGIYRVCPNMREGPAPIASSLQSQEIHSTDRPNRPF